MYRAKSSGKDSVQIEVVGAGQDDVSRSDPS
jgi:hypothetical protein